MNEWMKTLFLCQNHVAWENPILIWGHKITIIKSRINKKSHSTIKFVIWRFVFHIFYCHLICLGWWISFVIPRTSLPRGSLNRGSTVSKYRRKSKGGWGSIRPFLCHGGDYYEFGWISRFTGQFSFPYRVQLKRFNFFLFFFSFCLCLPVFIFKSDWV